MEARAVQCLFLRSLLVRRTALRYEIAGSKSTVEFNSEMPNRLWLGYRDKANEILLKDPSLSGELARR